MTVMDNYGDGGMGWVGWLAMVAMMVVFWGAVAWVLVTLVRNGGARSRPDAAPTDPMRILDERFARGEVDEVEYRHRRDLLRGGT